MRFLEMPIKGVVLLIPNRISDDRGYLSETFRTDIFKENVCPADFVQDNQSLSAQVGTVRGLHFQLAPRAQGKLVCCVAGAILDVTVDIRRGSPTFGQHVKAELTAKNGHQLWMPPGFAHGFCTLEPNSVISYKVTDYYSAKHDRGLLWSDPQLEIEWPIAADAAYLSAKDWVQPKLADLLAALTYEPVLAGD
ncbi:dTDP-4-dehydrorhamnose 3,5-epimerase [Rhizobium sp. Leaf262]|uniref:dTDP-4-dehydrorhamnose 3,5-epimerase n=1 Tax=Rhizobium sp. Leaf262 TaxID=1736312 RepID=UPI000712B484|nr:dTDP-4-dehydrorhamnose 3,5-epimerase [Rhizobium sp. Leaf262]KQO76263.1 dTDP-4-dehydrorhamnose 3,5-epimerase [Rhizobium sp. Leaf262]